MILPFSTQLNGKPTHFVEKIWEAILQKGIPFTYEGMEIGAIALPKGYVIKTHSPKLHTIREDNKNRWKVGTKIDFFINCRQKDMFRFAPVLPVISIQSVFMTYLPQCGNGFQVSIGGRKLNPFEIEVLAVNDGFDSVEEFENYFISVMKDDEFSGKLIHWTDFKY